MRLPSLAATLLRSTTLYATAPRLTPHPDLPHPFPHTSPRSLPRSTRPYPASLHPTLIPAPPRPTALQPHPAQPNPIQPNSTRHEPSQARPSPAQPSPVKPSLSHLCPPHGNFYLQRHSALSTSSMRVSVLRWWPRRRRCMVASPPSPSIPTPIPTLIFTPPYPTPPYPTPRYTTPPHTTPIYPTPATKRAAEQIITCFSIVGSSAIDPVHPHNHCFHLPHFRDAIVQFTPKTTPRGVRRSRSFRGLQGRGRRRQRSSCCSRGCGPSHTANRCVVISLVEEVRVPTQRHTRLITTTRC